MIVQKILPHDPVQRLQFSKHMLNILQDDLAVIITSNDSHLHLDYRVNKKNCRYGKDKPQIIKPETSA